METPTPSGPSTAALDHLIEEMEIRSALFFCARCDRVFSNPQSYRRHRNAHARNDMAAAMRRQAMRSSSQLPIQSTRLQYAPIHQRQHVQPRFQYGPYNTQTMNGLVPRGGLMTNPNRSSGGVSYPSPNFSISVICNGVNFNVGACGDRVNVVASNLFPYPNPVMAEPVPHVVASNLFPYPNPVMAEPVPTTNPVMPQHVPTTNPIMPQPVPPTNPGNVNIVTPSLGETIAGSSRRVTVVDGSNGVGIGEANENEELDLTLHL